MTSNLMKKYPKFEDYLSTQPKFKDIEDNIQRNKLSNIEQIMAGDLPLAKREPYTMGECPPGWESIFELCRAEIEMGLNHVNSHVATGKRVCPDNENLFRAFSLVRPENVKVVIIAQDPYHTVDTNTNICVATGVATGCNGPPQPTCRNICNEIKRTEGEFPRNTNFEFLAEQGVLMINVCLTVDKGEPGSHGTSWNAFTTKMLTLLFEQVEWCFLCLWGGDAKKIINGRNKVNYSKKKIFVLEAGHPSYRNKSAANQFYGCGHFQKIREIMIGNNVKPIDWVGLHLPQKNLESNELPKQEHGGFTIIDIPKETVNEKAADQEQVLDKLNSFAFD